MVKTIAILLICLLVFCGCATSHFSNKRLSTTPCTEEIEGEGQWIYGKKSGDWRHYSEEEMRVLLNYCPEQIEKQLTTHSYENQMPEGSESPSVSKLLKLSGGDTPGNPSNPGSRARKAHKSKAKSSIFAEAWSSNSHGSQNRWGGSASKYHDGLFGPFTNRPKPDPYNPPGGAHGPRSITVVSRGQRNSDLVENDNTVKNDNNSTSVELSRNRNMSRNIKKQR